MIQVLVPILLTFKSSPVYTYTSTSDPLLHRHKMYFVLAHLDQPASQLSGAPLKTTANKQAHDNRSLTVDSPMTLKGPTAFPNPPRPPTPGPPQPNPPVPPQPPVPTPPPSPHNLVVCDANTQLSIPASQATPFHYPYPNPPPSPGPRPGPVIPRPNVPTPPPSPQRSVDPWIFSIVSGFLARALGNLSLDIYGGPEAHEYVITATDNGTQLATLMPDLVQHSCQQLGVEV
ncbi:hypothetical protein F4802DRAFT_325448 [Xylaria palmicola]|nr:hypothetical protein F4802DRAFT_325448 [Xylaria palmicola]